MLEYPEEAGKLQLIAGYLLEGTQILRLIVKEKPKGATDMIETVTSGSLVFYCRPNPIIVDDTYKAIIVNTKGSH